jgi:hypothetical protein
MKSLTRATNFATVFKTDADCLQPTLTVAAVGPLAQVVGEQLLRLYESSMKAL